MVNYDLAKRQAYQAGVEVQRQAKVAAKKAALDALENKSSDIKLLVAVATKGQGRVNQHFGHASEFQIYEASTTGAKFIGHRRVDLYCQGGYDDDEALPGVIRAINDCHAILVAKIGNCPRAELKLAGIDPVEQYAHEFIEQSVIVYFNNYLAQVKAGQIVHQARGDAAIRQGALISLLA